MSMFQRCRWPGFVAWTGLLSLWLVCVPAEAQTENADAEALFRQGVEAFRGEDYAQAATHFEESFALIAQAKTACNLALTYDRWTGHPRQAREAYIRCAELDTSNRFRDHAIDRAAALRDELGDDPQPESDPTEPEENPNAHEQTPDPREADPVREVVHIPPPQPIVVSPIQASPPATGRILRWVGGGTIVAGVAVIAVGIPSSLGAKDDSDTLADRYPDRRIPSDDLEAQRLLQDIDDQERRARRLYIAGGALVGLGAILLVVGSVIPEPDEAGLSAIGISPTTGGATAHATVQF